MVPTGTVDNKFEFITVAAERCRQLQRGARPRIETHALKPVTIAQQEVLAGVIQYSYDPFPEEMLGEAELGEVTTESYAADDGGIAPSDTAI